MSYEYENDERAIARAVKTALETSAEIDHGTARAIASGYNDGANTAVYAFVSTGAMVTEEAFPTDALMEAFKRGVDAGTLERDASALKALEAYLQERENYDDLDRIDGWSDMWVPRHVDYPHQDGQLDTCWCCEEPEEAEPDADAYENDTPVHPQCSCRDCMDVSTTAAQGGWTLCRECLDAACTPYPPGTGPWPGRRPAGEYECLRDDRTRPFGCGGIGTHGVDHDG